MGIDTLTYSVSHRTVLRYTAKVSLSYNEVRMRPRDRGSQRTLAFSLLSKPWAVPRSRVDYFGNFVHRLDVTTPHQTARVHGRRRGREHRTAPPATLGMGPGRACRRPAPRVRAAEPARSAWREHAVALARVERRRHQLRQCPRDRAAHPPRAPLRQRGDHRRIEHRRSPGRGRRCLPGLHASLPGDGARRRLARAIRERVPRTRRRGEGG